MDLKTKTGLRIKELRSQKELTQEGLAWKAEINRSFMNHIENGRRNISLETLEKIVSGLDISLVDFFDAEIFNRKNNGND